jgi:hypothetical protein
MLCRLVQSGADMPAPEKPAHLFLSYARDDAEFVMALRAAVEARGWTTWMDQVSIPSASEWMAEIRRGIESADGFVLVLTHAMDCDPGSTI